MQEHWAKAFFTLYSPGVRVARQPKMKTIPGIGGTNVEEAYKKVKTEMGTV